MQCEECCRVWLTGENPLLFSAWIPVKSHLVVIVLNHPNFVSYSTNWVKYGVGLTWLVWQLYKTPIYIFQQTAKHSISNLNMNTGGYVCGRATWSGSLGSKWHFRLKALHKGEMANKWSSWTMVSLLQWQNGHEGSVWQGDWTFGWLRQHVCVKIMLRQYVFDILVQVRKEDVNWAFFFKILCLCEANLNIHM